LRCKRIRFWLPAAIVIAVAAFVSPRVGAATTRLESFDTSKQIRAQARRAEEKSQWLKAAGFYEQLLARNKRSAEFRQHYQNCLRRAQQLRRQQDVSYRHQVESLSLDNALKVYAEVVTKLQQAYVDKDKATFSLMFREGIRELENGLSDPSFCRMHLAHVDADAIRAFQEQVLVPLRAVEISRREEIQTTVRSLAVAAKTELGLHPSLLVVELASGACAGLDEYTHYLTPGQLIQSDALSRGELVGVGIELAPDEQRPVVECVLPASPAEAVGIRAGDRLLRIDDRTELTTENATDLLKGELDSAVELEVTGAGQKPRIVKLKRQVLSLPSVSEPRFIDEHLGIGYVQITGFQESTAQEVDTALAKLEATGMRALVLDLRGNMGGLFDVAVQVAERFLSSGIVAFTRGQSDESNVTYRARPMSTLTVPLVVLIDSDTASSAEMLAGALKDNHRGTLVGQPTFGKGSIQKVRKLQSVPAAIRMTVAKFYSPQGHPYADVGVLPDIAVERPIAVRDLDRDPQVQSALDAARRLIMVH
jgi:carboxyl-terminal processing protease